MLMLKKLMQAVTITFALYLLMGFSSEQASPTSHAQLIRDLLNQAPDLLNKSAELK